MGRAGRLIFLKRVTSVLLPFCVMLVVSIVSSSILNNLLEDTEVVRYIVFGLAALVMILGIILVSNVDEPSRYINTKRLLNNSIGLASIGFLLWKAEVIDYLANLYVLSPIFLVILFSYVYERKFKRLILNELLQEVIQEDFDFLVNDNQKTAELLEKQMISRLKEKYKDSFLIRTLNFSKNISTGLTEFAIGFLTKEKHPKVLFELVIGLKME